MILTAENLTKSFGGLRAVGGVSFALAENEILGVAGPNGSGKSTLFNILTSIPFPADSGRIVFDGPSTALTNDFLAELYGEASEELVLPDAPAESPAGFKLANRHETPVPETV